MLVGSEALARLEVEQKCKDLTRMDFVLDSQGFQDFFSTEEASGTGSVYDALGRFTFEIFRRTHLNSSDCPEEIGQILQTDNVKSGFGIAAKLISVSPGEYLKYCNYRDIEPHVNDLAAALRRSKKTPLELMNMPNKLNSTVEYVLGLRDAVVSNEGAFYFEETEKGPLLVIDRSELRMAKFYAHQEGYLPGERGGIPTDKQYCPARGLMVGRLWPAMIDLASTAHQAFQRDLSQQI